MYILKNAYYFITRNISRNILLGIIIVIIGISSVIALSINNAATEIVNNKILTSTPEITFEPNRDNMKRDFESMLNGMKEGDNISSLTGALSLEEILNYSDSSYVKDTYITSSLMLNSSQIETASNDTLINNYNRDQFGATSMPSGGSSGSKTSGISMMKGDYIFEGYNSINALENFANGTYTLTEGSMIEDFETITNEILINEELASQNDLTIGSTIIFTNPLNEEETFTLAVKGIFTDNGSVEDVSNMFSNSANTIITTLPNIDSITATSSEEFKITSTLTPVILLNSFEDISAYTSEVTEKGLDDSFAVISNEEEILATLEPTENLKNFSNIFLVLVLVIGSLILMVLNMINIRERKYEIGVLRAIGMKKGFVAMQFVLETFLVTIVAISIGIILGSTLSMPVADAMLASEIATQTEAANEVNQNFGFKDPMSGRNNNLTASSNLNYIDSIDASVNLEVILQVFGISLLITILGSLISIITISRYKPLTILNSRS